VSGGRCELGWASDAAWCNIASGSVVVQLSRSAAAAVSRHSPTGSVLSVESNQNAESKAEKCGVQNSVFTSRNQESY